MKNLLSYPLLIPLALFLGLAPVHPQPHLVEKLGMLMEGALKKPIDIFDLAWHTWPFALLIVRLGKDAKRTK
ncbi:hypothetical protein A7E78_12405 [Syntrophotalea acetylenivorans]|uniref:RND transporter n=1 Tax=Syntrophotalea acetylenivorans TaxID=1842532 RepID=A0A1L3GRK8_9BACT|nr:hypothetical protein A7E78_12405 [Syntrophotalea acetylenivorans]